MCKIIHEINHISCFCIIQSTLFLFYVCSALKIGKKCPFLSIFSRLGLQYFSQMPTLKLTKCQKGIGKISIFISLFSVRKLVRFITILNSFFLFLRVDRHVKTTIVALFLKNVFLFLRTTTPLHKTVLFK